ncbi:MAG: hypothetical protein ACT4OK_19565 [Gemmobacter sp.]
MKAMIVAPKGKMGFNPWNVPPMERQDDLYAIFDEERQALQACRIARCCHPLQAMPGPQVGQIVDTGQRQGGLSPDCGRDACMAKNAFERVTWGNRGCE